MPSTDLNQNTPLRFQFTHWQTLAAVVIAIWGVCCIGLWLSQSLQQRRAIDLLQSRGVKVSYPEGVIAAALPMWFRSRGGGLDFWNCPEYIDASRSRLTDADLELFRRIHTLTRLDMDNTAVTDAGLAQLHGLKELRKIDLSGTNVSDTAVDRLQEAIPNCEIHR